MTIRPVPLDAPAAPSETTLSLVVTCDEVLIAIVDRFALGQAVSIAHEALTLGLPVTTHLMVLDGWRVSADGAAEVFSVAGRRYSIRRADVLATITFS